MDDYDNVNRRDVDEVDVSEGKLANRSMQIQALISNFEYRLKGFMWTGNADKMKYIGKPLLGKDSIQRTILLLHPFSSEVLLICDKKNFTWQKQMLRTRLEFIRVITKAIDCDVRNQHELFRSFSNLMFNIGDIIVNKNSQKVLGDYLNGVKEEAGGSTL